MIKVTDSSYILCRQLSWITKFVSLASYQLCTLGLIEVSIISGGVRDV